MARHVCVKEITASAMVFCKSLAYGIEAFGLLNQFFYVVTKGGDCRQAPNEYKEEFLS